MQKIKEFIIINKRIIISIVSIIIVIALAEEIFEGEIFKGDLIAYSIIMKSRNDMLTSIVKVITNLGSATVVGIISIGCLIFIKNKKIGLCVLGNLGCITLLNVLLKNIVQRPRPDGYRIIDESGYSFPSGHSMVSTAFYGLLIYLIYKNVKNKKIKYALCIALAILPIAICCSRVYLGVHYASDVLAGFFISLAYLMIVTKITYKIINEKK